MSSPHKLLQLCRQVEEAVGCALIASADPALRDLFVLTVEPACGAGLLRVVLTTSGTAELELAELSGKLARARSYLRSEVASSIHRKRVPSLELVIVPMAS